MNLTLIQAWPLCMALGTAVAIAQPAVPNSQDVDALPTGSLPTRQGAKDRAPAAAPQPRPAAPAPTALADMPKGLGFEGAAKAEAEAESGPVERITYKRSPVTVNLATKQERSVTFPVPVALHVPEGFESVVRAQVNDRTVYLTPLAPFGLVRIAAEDLQSGRQFMLDLVESPPGLKSNALEIIVAASDQPRAVQEPATRSSSEQAPPLDMVALTRYAAQALYAPKRLAPAAGSVRQVPVATKPVEGLYRGWNLETVPMGAWRSGQLFVTAVRFTNLSGQPLDLDMRELRGQWLAATPQHSRLLPAGTDWSTSTVYLVCERAFEACR